MKGLKDDDGPPIVVCVPVAGRGMDFPDNLTDMCMFCGVEVQLRPHNPWPRRICCIHCFAQRCQPGDKMVATGRTVREVRAWFKKAQYH